MATVQNDGFGGADGGYSGAPWEEAARQSGHGQKRHGRLVLVVEKALSDASRHALRHLLNDLLREPEVTMVAGFGRASMMAAAQEGGSRIFYNHAEPLPPALALHLMPWRSVWLVGGGRVIGCPDVRIFS